MEVDILTIAAHPDDIEITCGGTVIKMTEAGYRVGILDLTAGESGTRGSAALREKEARRAAQVLGVVHRENLNIPEGRAKDSGIQAPYGNSALLERPSSRSLHHRASWLRSLLSGGARQAATGGKAPPPV
jgi:LmbE family N-acetylglucosaminyl deacetylase